MKRRARRGAAWWLASSLLGGLSAACGGATSVEPTTPEADEPGPELALALQITEAIPGEGDLPRSGVRLVLIDPEGERRVEEVGVFGGICQPARFEDALVGVSCWWAGAGDELRATREGDAIVGTRTPLDEMAGDLPSEEVARVELPARARLRVVTGMP